MITRLVGLLAAALALAWCVGASSARAEVLTAGNGIYTVAVNSETGEYTVATGPTHPLGPGLSILFGSGTPGTSTDSIHSYTTATDYLLKLVTTQETRALGSTGFETTYTLATPAHPDDLRVVQTVRADGTTFTDSRVEVTTVVTNTGSTPVTLGLRYLWDYQVNEDDGPTFEANEPDGPVLLSEAAFPSPAFDHYTIQDNDGSPSPPTFDVLGTVTGPASAEPVAPTLLVDASWSKASETVFSYEPGGETVSSSSEGPNDNAVLYYWGDHEADAPTIPPSGSYRASASLFLNAPGGGLPGSPHTQVTTPPATNGPPAPSGPALPPPLLGSTANIEPVSGTVLIEVPGAGRFIPLTSAEQIPIGSIIDARHGRARLTTAKGRGGSAQTAEFYGGEFKVLQPHHGKPVTELKLTGFSPSDCAGSDSTRLQRGGDSHNALWGNGHGRYVTRGHAGSAAVRGTIWLTDDRCDGTLFVSKRDTVVVRDFKRHRTITLHTGQRYLASLP